MYKKTEESKKEKILVPEWKRQNRPLPYTIIMQRTASGNVFMHLVVRGHIHDNGPVRKAENFQCNYWKIGSYRAVETNANNNN
jgi:hypothetical protein